MKNPRGCVIYRPVKCVAIQTGSAIRLGCICLVPRSHLLKRRELKKKIKLGLVHLSLVMGLHVTEQHSKA